MMKIRNFLEEEKFVRDDKRKNQLKSKVKLSNPMRK